VGIFEQPEKNDFFSILLERNSHFHGFGRNAPRPAKAG